MTIYTQKDMNKLQRRIYLAAFWGRVRLGGAVIAALLVIYTLAGAV